MSTILSDSEDVICVDYHGKIGTVTVLVTSVVS
jgi:hypothetical protein